MTDNLTPEQRSERMSRIGSGWRKNKLERFVHQWLVAHHVNHRMNPRRTPGHPDAMIYGTTARVARSLGRRSILIELNPAYVALARRRSGADTPALEAFEEVSAK